MKRSYRGLFTIAAILLFAAALFRLFLPGKNAEVVIYVSHDQDYAQPVLEAFEKETGITVKAVYDTEASKTVGLTNRLIAEKQNPQADVFWNNEVLRTLELKKQGVLDVFYPENAAKIDDKFRDPEGYWTGFAARARVLVVNTDYVKKDDMPKSLEDLSLGNTPSHLTLADPRFGTTGPHIAALMTVWGGEKTKTYFRDLKQKGLDIAQSNGATRDKVVSGEKWIGFTDTDDANDALVDKKPVSMIYPDQQPGGIGTLVIPNTVMLIRGSKQKEAAKNLINFLISDKTESMLAHAKSVQMPLLPGVDTPSTVPDVSSIVKTDVTWDQIFANLEKALKFADEELVD